ncbi:MAG: nitrous oxide reductase family maturation protein NosD [Candidatus Hermodarchaeota archaeon]
MISFNSNSSPNKQMINLKNAYDWDLTGTPILIDGNATGVDAHNWSWVEEQIWFGGGNGSKQSPYIIENIIINGQDSTSCIKIINSEKHFILRNCSFYNAIASYPWVMNGAVILINVTNGKLLDNNCSNNNGRGICMENSHYNEISNNTLNNNPLISIVLYNCQNNNLTTNRINGIDKSGYGISLYSEYRPYPHVDSTFNNITGNIIRNCDLAILLHSSGENTVSQNTLFNNEVAIRSGGNGNKLLENNINYNKNGIDAAALNNIVSSNFITNNYQFGIFIEIPGVKQNTFYNNTFIGNAKHAVDNGQNNKWNFNSIGNYWDNYTGVDANDDGIGDTPMKILGDSLNYDNFPIWWDPPTIQIHNPYENQIFGLTPPNFTISIVEGIADTVWYTLDNGEKEYINSLTGNISQEAWDMVEEGQAKIIFYANDSRGSIGFKEINIQKQLEIVNSNRGVIFGYNLITFLISVFFVVTILTIISIVKTRLTLSY